MQIDKLKKISRKRAEIATRKLAESRADYRELTNYSNTLEQKTTSVNSSRFSEIQQTMMAADKNLGAQYIRAKMLSAGRRIDINLDSLEKEYQRTQQQIETLGMKIADLELEKKEAEKKAAKWEEISSREADKIQFENALFQEQHESEEREELQLFR